MKVIGCSFIRNAIRYDYPIVEAIQSILPLCDEVVVAVGKSEDDTLALVQGIHPEKIRIIKTTWQEQVRAGGQVLALETNKALDAVLATKGDWCIYIQGDEVLHEADYDTIRIAMQTNLNDTNVEGLLFQYRHFYGSYDFLGDSRNWYRQEVRIIRPDAAIRSYQDAQGFRKNNQKLWVKPVEAYVHHYGWVKHPVQQQRKQQNFNKLWHDDHWMETHIPKVSAFDYSQIDSLARFTGTHPKVMHSRIARMNWTFDFDPTQRKLSTKERLSRWWERQTGIRLGEYRNYRIL
ncbi:MAG: glycosyltransferase family 2 protein [Bacteroidota bacterium]